MAVTSTPIFPQTIQNWGVQILPADTTAKKTLVTGGTNGTKIESINVASDDTAAKNLILYLSDGTTDYLLTWVNIPATSGFTTSNPSVAVLQNTQLPSTDYDSNGNKVFFLKSGWIIKVAVSAAVTTAKTIHITASGADF
jgi:hypothetical protein